MGSYEMSIKHEVLRAAAEYLTAGAIFTLILFFLPWVLLAVTGEPVRYGQ